MSENSSTNTPERFREVEPLHLAGWRSTYACVTGAARAAIVIGDEYLTVDDARALRDWLTKALPEEKP